ncbi:1-acyl-sn-glycerol-3-phosphate acyltransferase [Kocuria rhizophila]|nr:1-acyl-sn-glycerol-3-phosphate acyltransferase [Kocuria rhizophila]
MTPGVLSVRHCGPPRPGPPGAPGTAQVPHRCRGGVSGWQNVATIHVPADRRGRDPRVPLARGAALARRRRRPASGGFVVVSNHLAEIDPDHRGLCGLQGGRVMPRFLAGVPVPGARAGPGAHADRAGSVYRGPSRAKDSLEAAFAELASGERSSFTPRGTSRARSGDEAACARRTGAARLALQADVPVVPMVHWGTRVRLTGTPRATAPPSPSRPSVGRDRG